MAGKQAKILSDDHVRDLLSYAACTRHPDRNEVLVLLSTKAGLRAGEIANLTWDMVVDPNGQIGDGIALWDRAAKRRSGRLIPLHPQLRTSLIRWRALTRIAGPVVVGQCHPTGSLGWDLSITQFVPTGECSRCALSNPSSPRRKEPEHALPARRRTPTPLHSLQTVRGSWPPRHVGDGWRHWLCLLVSCLPARPPRK